MPVVTKSIAHYLLYFLSPILAAVVAFWNHRACNSKNIIWLFVIFYAVTFSIPSEASDAFRYRERFEALYYSTESLTEFSQYIYSDKYSPDTGTTYTDLYLPVLSYVVSRFTDNYHFLYLFVGLFFGYFYSRNIWLLLEYSGYQKLRLEGVILLTVFILLVPFWSLNSIRMWTAAHVFFYGIMQFLLFRKKSGLIIGLSSFLIHFSFLIAVLVMVLYLLLGNKYNLFFGLFLGSFFITELDFSAVSNTLSDVLPSFFSRKVDAYSPGSELTQLDERNWYVTFYWDGIRYFSLVLISVFWLKAEKIYHGYLPIKRLFSFCLLFLSVAQLVALFSSGGRFVIVGYLFTFALLFFYFQNKSDFASRLCFYAMMPLVILFILVVVRIGLNSISIDIIGNPFIAIFKHVDIPLIELIKR